MKNKSKLAMITAFAALMLCQGAVLFAETAKMHVDVGLNHFYKNRYLEAYREFKQAIEVDPNYAEAYYNLGRVYKAQGFIKEALVEFQLALRIKPDYTAAQRELDALSQSLASDVNQSLRMQGRENYRQTEFDSISSDEAERRARQYLNQGNSDEAIRYYSIVLRERPNDVSIHKMLGFLNFKGNHYTDALANYQSARKYAPADPEIPYAIGLIYMKTGSPEKAESFFKDAIKLQKDMTKAYFALGESYEAQAKIDDAAFQFQKCLDLNPNLKEAKTKLDYLVGKQSYNYFSRGSYYYQRGDYEKALPLLSMAKSHGSLTADQNRQIEEMLNASQYWVSKQQAEKQEKAERQQVLSQANITRSVNANEVSSNPNPYMGKAIEWEGEVVFVDADRGGARIFVNSNPGVDSDTNMNDCFLVKVSKNLADDPRIASDNTWVTVKGKITGVEKVFNTNSQTFSSRKQPVVEAVEIKFTRDGFDQPLILRF